MKILHIAFYRFVRLDDPQRTAIAMREIASGLTGSVLIAIEGVNGTLAGGASALDQFEQALCSDRRFGGAFEGLRFQRTECVTPPFQRLKVHVKAEVVQIGVADVDLFAHSDAAGINVAPQDWDALIARADVVLIDNRNHFEFALGHFRGALDPNVSRFQDFAQFMTENLPGWAAAGKKIAMYCTGGIRCEKTSAWLAAQNVQAYQLDGGVLNYLGVKSRDNDTADKTVRNTEPSAWTGDCFVFDNRMALDKNLTEQKILPEQVYAAPEDAWRLARARRLADESDSNV
jgi:UPF0176 protein